MSAPLESYAIVAAPSLNILEAAEAAKLRAYVERGGWLVLGPRSGFKDGDARLWPARAPGPLSAILVAGVLQHYALGKPATVSGELGAGSAGIWGEDIEAWKR